MDTQLTIWDVLERRAPLPPPSELKARAKRARPSPHKLLPPPAVPPDPAQLLLAFAPAEPAYQLEEEPAPERSIMALRHGMCRAVIGEHEDVSGGLYCCEPTTTKSFCAEHHKLYYEPKGAKRSDNVFLNKRRFARAA